MRCVWLMATGAPRFAICAGLTVFRVASSFRARHRCGCASLCNSMPSTGSFSMNFRLNSPRPLCFTWVTTIFVLMMWSWPGQAFYYTTLQPTITDQPASGPVYVDQTGSYLRYTDRASTVGQCCDLSGYNPVYTPGPSAQSFNVTYNGSVSNASADITAGSLSVQTASLFASSTSGGSDSRSQTEMIFPITLVNYEDYSSSNATIDLSFRLTAGFTNPIPPPVNYYPYYNSDVSRLTVQFGEDHAGTQNNFYAQQGTFNYSISDNSASYDQNLDFIVPLSEFHYGNNGTLGFDVRLDLETDRGSYGAADLVFQSLTAPAGVVLTTMLGSADTGGGAGGAAGTDVPEPNGLLAMLPGGLLFWGLRRRQGRGFNTGVRRP